METSLTGRVVIIQFPFSDLTGSKKRSALIVADWGGDDVILAQITSIAHKEDSNAIELNDNDFLNGSLKKESYIRPNKLFTADKLTFLQNIGVLNPVKMEKITDTICRLIRLRI